MIGTERVLVAGVGNIFKSDDGFGSAVAGELLTRDIPEHVSVIDYGIRGMHLAFDLSDDVVTLILIDTVPDAGEVGGVVVIEVDPADYGSSVFDAHSMDPNTVLESVAAMTDPMPRTLIVGCQPECLDDGIGLSPLVTAAVPIAADAAIELAVREVDSLQVEESARRK